MLQLLIYLNVQSNYSNSGVELIWWRKKYNISFSIGIVAENGNTHVKYNYLEIVGYFE